MERKGFFLFLRPYVINHDGYIRASEGERERDGREERVVSRTNRRERRFRGVSRMNRRERRFRGVSRKNRREEKREGGGYLERTGVRERESLC